MSSRQARLWIDRRWTATITYKGDPPNARRITTTIHGRNPTDAEETYRREHPEAAGIVIHHEQR